MSAFPEYDRYDGLGLAELVQRREVTPQDLVEEAIRRIESVNPELNAVIYRAYDEARSLAQKPPGAGPFAGVPFLVKDLVSALKGHPMTMGSRALKSYVPDHDSELMARYKRAGLVILGKTNTPELGLAPITEPVLFGPTKNPWDVTRTPSGSSGGSAAAVAARMVPMAGGGDGGGSIRTPASACGVFGLKPSRGRNPIGPERGEIWQGFTTEHVLTRTVRDSAAMLDAISGPEPGISYVAPPPARPFLEEVGAHPGKLKVAYHARSLLGNHVDPSCVRALEDAVSLVRELGHSPAEVVLPIDKKQFTRAFLSVVCAETAADVDEMQRFLGRRLGPSHLELATRFLALLGRALGAHELAAARRYLYSASRQICEALSGYDVFLTPTLAAPPVPIGSLQPSRAERTLAEATSRLRGGRVVKALGLLEVLAASTFEFTGFTAVFNVTGQPAASLPLSWNEAGLPIGTQIVARYGDEATLFRLASQLEEARPWRDRRPPVCAR